MLELVTSEHNEYVPLEALKSVARSPEVKQSPNQSKAAGKRQQRQKIPPPEDQISQTPLPNSAVTEFGVTKNIQHFLEVSYFCLRHMQSKTYLTDRHVQISESISLMAPLFSFSHANKQLSAKEALNQMVVAFQNNQAQMQQQPSNPNLNPQHPQFNPNNVIPHHPNQAPNPQAQNFAAFQQSQMIQNNQFLSPAQGAHLSLPNQTSNPNSNSSTSPATLTHSNHPTPSMQTMALQNSMGVPMAAQGSHQGTSAGATPVGGSPNVGGKRRRASAVGLGMTDADGSGVEVNGIGGPAKVKQSPRVGGKRQKGAG